MASQEKQNLFIRAGRALAEGGFALDKRSVAPYEAMGKGIDIGAKAIRKNYVPIVLSSLLTAGLIGVVSNLDSLQKNFYLNTSAESTFFPRIITTGEEITKSETPKIRTMIQGHNLNPIVSIYINQYLDDLSNFSQSEYSRVVEKRTNNLGQTVYIILYDKQDGSKIKTLLLSSNPPKLSESNATYERLAIILDDTLSTDIDYRTIQARLKQDSANTFAYMSIPHTEFMGTTPNSPHFEAYTKGGADEEVPGTFSVTASTKDGKEILEHWYAKAKAVVQVEAPVEVSPLSGKLEQALGENWMDITHTAGLDLNNRLYWGFAAGETLVYMAENPLSPEDKDFYQRAYYSMGMDHAGFSQSSIGFINNLSVDYARGKGYFTRMYGKIFTPDQVNNLYIFVKEDIFKGKEY